MSSEYVMTALKELLQPVNRPETVEADKTYHILGAHWYAEGLYIKDTKPGSGIQADKVYRVEEGDFVYNRLFAWKGSFAVATHDNHNCYVSNEFPAFKLDRTQIDAKYLWKYFSRETAWNEALGLSSGGTPTSRNRLKEEKLLAMEIPLPPLEEQRRIVARIEELAAKIEEALGLRREAVQEKENLLESSITKVFHTFRSVEKKSLKMLSSKIGSGSTPLGGRSGYASSGIPFIRSLNVRMRQFTWEGIAYIDDLTHENMRNTIVKPNDVLLNITGASIGRVACAPEDILEANVNQHVAIIRPIEYLQPRYLMYWLSQPAIQKVINSEQKGATRQGFTKSQIENFMVPFPSEKEQLSTISYLDEIQAQINLLERHQFETTAELNALLPSILDKAFKGEL